MKNKLLRGNAVKAIALALLAVLILAGSVSADQKDTVSAQSSYAQAKKAMLYIRSFYQSGSVKSTGSGFIVTKDGLAVTAAHVINNGAKITALLPDGTELEAAVISCNVDTDVAVLKLPTGEYTPLKLGSDSPDGGFVVRAMGYPMKDTLIITEGIVAAPKGTVSGKERMLVTCDIVNGMSGGPVFNEYGEVVGVVSGSIRTMDGIHLSTMSNALYDAVNAAAANTEAKGDSK